MRVHAWYRRSYFIDGVQTTVVSVQSFPLEWKLHRLDRQSLLRIEHYHRERPSYIRVFLIRLFLGITTHQSSRGQIIRKHNAIKCKYLGHYKVRRNRKEAASFPCYSSMKLTNSRTKYKKKKKRRQRFIRDGACNKRTYARRTRIAFSFAFVRPLLHFLVYFSVRECLQERLISSSAVADAVVTTPCNAKEIPRRDKRERKKRQSMAVARSAEW